MNILQSNKLNSEQVRDIEDLEQVCQKNDGLKDVVSLSNELNFDRDINCYFLLYDEEKLISFLSMFIPTQKEAEISAYTLPNKRNNGYFKVLFEKAGNQLNKYNIKEILFVHEPASKEGKYVLDKLNAKYDFSEYLLDYSLDNVLEDNDKLKIEAAMYENISEIVKLDMDIFCESFENAQSIVIKSMNSEKILSYIAKFNNEIIGVCNVNVESEDVSIFGVGISPKYQGRGFGKEMLNRVIEKLLNMDIKNITLEVNSINNRAYNLYTNNGFKVKTQYDYYRYLL